MRLFSLIKSGDLHLHEGQKIVPQELYTALVDIETLLQTAKDDIDSYRQDVEEESKEIKQQAFDSGYQEGLTQFHQHLIFFEDAIRQLKIEVQQQVLPLVLKATKKIIGEHLRLHPDTIVSIIQQVIKPVLTHHQIKLHVNKKDKAIIEENKEEIKKLFERLEFLSIEEDNSIESGSVKIETESGIINASLENQWRALEAAFAAFAKKTSS